MYEAFAERFRTEKKDEFETTEQYRRRLERRRAEPVPGDIRAESPIGFPLPGSHARYDADAGVEGFTPRPWRLYGPSPGLRRHTG